MEVTITIDRRAPEDVSPESLMPGPTLISLTPKGFFSGVEINLFARIAFAAVEDRPVVVRAMVLRYATPDKIIFFFDGVSGRAFLRDLADRYMALSEQIVFDMPVVKDLKYFQHKEE